MNRPYQVMRDGKLLAGPFDTENQAFEWIHNYQSQSVDWAMKYEGYRIEKVSK